MIEEDTWRPPPPSINTCLCTHTLHTHCAYNTYTGHMPTHTLHSHCTQMLHIQNTYTHWTHTVHVHCTNIHWTHSAHTAYTYTEHTHTAHMHTAHTLCTHAIPTTYTLHIYTLNTHSTHTLHIHTLSTHSEHTAHTTYSPHTHTHCTHIRIHEDFSSSPVTYLCLPGKPARYSSLSSLWGAETLTPHHTLFYLILRCRYVHTVFIQSNSQGSHLLWRTDGFGLVHFGLILCF